MLLDFRNKNINASITDSNTSHIFFSVISIFRFMLNSKVLHVD